MRISTLSLVAALALVAGCSGSSEELIITAADNEDQVAGNPASEGESVSPILAMFSGATFVSTDSSAPAVVRFTNDEVFLTQSGITTAGSYLNNGESTLSASFSSGDIPFSAAGGNIIWNSAEFRRTARLPLDSQESLTVFLDGATYTSVELLAGGERPDGTVGTNNWSLRFEGDNAFWATRDTIAVGTYSFVDGSSFDVSFGGSVMRVALLESDQIVVSGSVYEKEFSNQFNSQESLTGFLDGASYESVGLQQVGSSVDGTVALGRWRIDFSNDTFQWFYLDVAEAGTVGFLDNSSFTAVFNDRELVIEVDGDDLVWDNVRYSRVSP